MVGHIIPTIIKRTVGSLEKGWVIILGVVVNALEIPGQPNYGD
jgi:hypothetical protein